MAIDPVNDIKSAISNAIKEGIVLIGDDGLPVVQSGDTKVKLVENDTNHTGFDAVVITKEGSDKGIEYSYKTSPGVFKNLTDFVAHEKAVASGGVTSELGEKRERRAAQLKLPDPSIKARDRAETVMDTKDVARKYTPYLRDQAKFGEEILADMGQCRNKEQMQGLIDEMFTVLDNFRTIRAAVSGHPACEYRSCERILTEIDKAISYFKDETRKIDS